MSKLYDWSEEEKQILRRNYKFGADVAMLRLLEAGYDRSRGAIRTKASTMLLKCDPDAIREMRRAAGVRLMAEAGGKNERFKSREGPFEYLPDEYLKVSSIFRVGQRFAAQEVSHA